MRTTPSERCARGWLLIEAVSSRMPRRSCCRCGVGIATGLAVVGDLIGAGCRAGARRWSARRRTWRRDCRRVAAPGALVIAENTRRLVGGLFEYRGSRRRQALEGLRRARYAAWQVLRAKARRRAGSRRLRTATTPLVGRDEEIELLTAPLGTGEERARAVWC